MKAIFRCTVSLLVMAALVLISCGPKSTPAPITAPTPAPSAPTPAVPAPVAPIPAAKPASTPAEKPKYGGTINLIMAVDSPNYDTVTLPQGLGEAAMIIYDRLIDSDFSKGQAGSGLVDWGQARRWEGFGPSLAESWKMPERGTYVLQIRRGARFALDPGSEASRLVNGREFTADDAVWSINYNTKTPTSSIRRSQPGTAIGAAVEKTGPWEVTLKTVVDPMAGFWWIAFGGNSQHMWAREIVDKFGSTREWRNTVGTGAWMVSDVVIDSVTTLKKNPNYWGKQTVDPGKGDQIPYIDTVKLLVVPDLSTRLAAMRTARGDWVTDIQAEDAFSLTKTSPNLQYKQYLEIAPAISMRVDKTELPFKDKRIRQALMMATDLEAFKNDLYRGQAEIIVYPALPEYKESYVPLNDLPGSVQALFKYNPEKAKQLLADAGFPKGFKTKMVVQNISTQMDPAAAVKAMWAKVGVDVEIQPRETAVYRGMPPDAVDELWLGTAGMVYFPGYLAYSGLRGPTNRSQITDPLIEKYNEDISKHIPMNMQKAYEIFRESMPYVLEQAYYVPLPSPYSYRFWQPWVKGYRGEKAPQLFWLKHVWVDQDLKDKMTGKR